MNVLPEQTFITLLRSYTDDPTVVQNLWIELAKNYSHKKRFYHNLTHLENLLVELHAVKAHIKDWDCILFTLFYHDAIYNTLKSNNEEKSADLAEKRMLELNVPLSMINACKEQILATKKHGLSANPDTNFFTDADLSILGYPPDVYDAYAKNIRREYAVYPDLIYLPGRKKVLQHFLAMYRIYKTDYFTTKFEQQARQNLESELNSL